MPKFNLIDSLRDKRLVKEPLGVAVGTDENGNTVIEAHKSTQIKTLDQLLEAAEVDRDKWEVW